MIISNTRITTHNTCTLQEHYMYTLGLVPRNLSLPLYRGILGHSALETYYSLIADGLSSEEAAEAALMVVDSETQRIGEEEVWNDEKLQEAFQIRKRIKAYPSIYANEPFRIISVEKQYLADFTADVQFGFIPDLVVEMIRGPKKGQVGIIDHKFQYNWKTVEELQLDGQLPKYRKALRLNGIPVQWVMFNQVRTRDMNYRAPSDMFRRSYGLANDTADETIWAEQAETALEITVEHDFPEAAKKPRRALAPMVCKSCFYREPCMLSLNGQDVTRLLEMDYEPKVSPFKEIYND